ncbi:TAXI family TRAP transporter solute-binding subunit [Azospirillum sp. ST 5-10]|uniref:TAXI family TRAP transporter solute-binding subunit n=1 Tax=unclassified Azospirillum TaxID=2630922 RepID=UPI003F4A4BC8
MRHAGLVLSTVLAALAAGGAAAAEGRDGWPQSLTIATASPGGPFAIYGQGVASLISDVVQVPTSTQQTQGPNQNMLLVDARRTDFGMTTMGPAHEAWNGKLELNPGVEHRNVRALFPMYQTPFQAIALARSGIAGLKDLDGKVVGVGPKAGTGGTYWPRWFEAVGIDVTERSGPIGDQGSQLGDGRLDAIVTAGGAPHPTFVELEAQNDVVVFSLGTEEIAKILPTSDYLSPYEIPAGTYKSLAKPLPTVAMWNFFIAHKDLPEDLVYEVVKAVHANHPRLLQVHAVAAETLPENVAHNKFIWFHPGAVRYYREQGIDIPAALLPPDMKS